MDRVHCLRYKILELFHIGMITVFLNEIIYLSLVSLYHILPKTNLKEKKNCKKNGWFGKPFLSASPVICLIDTMSHFTRSKKRTIHCAGLRGRVLVSVLSFLASIYTSNAVPLASCLPPRTVLGISLSTFHCGVRTVNMKIDDPGTNPAITLFPESLVSRLCQNWFSST